MFPEHVGWGLIRWFAAWAVLVGFRGREVDSMLRCSVGGGSGAID